jgi:hypothetical protein
LPKKANTGSTKFPLPIATQLCKKRKAKLNSRKPVLRTHQKPPIYITDIKNILPLIQLLEHIAKQQYEIKMLSKTIRLKFSLKLLNPTEL